MVEILFVFFVLTAILVNTSIYVLLEKKNFLNWKLKAKKSDNFRIKALLLINAIFFVPLILIDILQPKAGLSLFAGSHSFFSDITWVTISVIIEVGALLHLVKWELIRELKRKEITPNETYRLFYKASQFITGFFIILILIFVFFASFKYLAENGIPTEAPERWKKGVFGWTIKYINFWVLLYLYILFFLGALIRSIPKMLPNTIIFFYPLPKNIKKITLEKIFKKKLIAVCMVIFALSVPIFLVTIDRYHLF